jgi:TonB family protein
VSDPVSGVIARRQALESGFSRSVVVSVIAHLLVLGVAVAGPLLLPKKPVLTTADGFAVPVPKIGGGSPDAGLPAPAARAAPPQPQPSAAPKPEAKPKPEPPKILKPPKGEKRRGVPAPDSRKVRSKPKPEPAPPQTGGMPGGTGSSTQTLGIGGGPPRPGLFDGTATDGDWYLATVQQKIWMLWQQQIRTGPQVAVRVSFTILADGSVQDVHVVQSSGIYLLDQAAQRAVVSAAPFGPLPKNYGTNRYTIHALFKPNS